MKQKGFFSLFKPRVWEVMAAVDKSKESGTTKRNLEYIFPQNDEMKRDISEIKMILKQSNFSKSISEQQFVNNHLARWEQNLLESGINENIICTLLQGIQVDSSQEQEEIDALIYEEVRNKAYSLLSDVYRDTERKRILVFIGPTGVGKTTTIAKLAARFALFQHKKMGIITIDTYRIGAVEQLKTYGEILDVPVEVVMTPPELREAVDRNSDKDCILIDTSGRSYKNVMQLRVLKGFLEKIPESEVFLVLSSTTKESDLMKNVENFGSLGFSRFILTKTDETDSLGSILNLALDLKKPVEYITNGQSVPDDIELIHPGKLAEMVLGGIFSEGPGGKVKRPRSVSV